MDFPSTQHTSNFPVPRELTQRSMQNLKRHQDCVEGEGKIVSKEKKLEEERRKTTPRYNLNELGSQLCLQCIIYASQFKHSFICTQLLSDIISLLKAPTPPPTQPPP